QFPVTVTDHAGREVVIDEEPQKLVSCYYITTSLLMALDLDERIVGIEDNPDYRPVYGLSAPYLLELPWVGTAKVLDVEGCAALEPDLVVLPLRLKESAEILEELGIDVLLVNPESQTLLNEMITMVGTATGTTEKAESLLSFIEEQQEYLDGLLLGAETPSVYLAGNSGMLQTAGDAMYQSDMIRLAGGKNAATSIEDTYWAEIDYEQLLTWNPEYIVLASNAAYTVEDVLSDPNLAGCTAVLNKNVYQIPADAEAWDSPVPGSILGALWLANVLHPDLLSDTDCTAIMDDYYETFYSFAYSEIKK
ncbi:MAG: ABC transporter substrate-binding protein, partial [Clostridia bacterium]|nr:ABC transporter substrate-binding protein [Clostridia bacterium]